MTQEFIGTNQVTAWPEEQDGAPGYAVKHADGSTSWSPKDTFEATYLPMGYVDHLLPHQQRVIGEKTQLNDKVEKLATFVNGTSFPDLSEADARQLLAQLAAMREYLAILNDRIAAFAQ